MKTLKSLFLILILFASTILNSESFGQEDEWYTVNKNDGWKFQDGNGKWKTDSDYIFYLNSSGEFILEIDCIDVDDEVLNELDDNIKVSIVFGYEEIFDFDFDFYKDDENEKFIFEFSSMYPDTEEFMLEIKNTKPCEDEDTPNSIYEASSVFSETKIFDSFGNINIETDLNEYTVSVFSVEGKMIYNQLNYNNTIINENFKTGLYIITLEVNGVRKSEKIYIQ